MSVAKMVEKLITNNNIGNSYNILPNNNNNSNA